MPQASQPTHSAGELLDDLIAGISERLQSGHSVDIEECCRDHPELADQLHRALPAMLALAELGHHPDAAANDEPSQAADGAEPRRTPGTLGDFRILGEIGRGGMGVVYEAEQLSLNRRVALKVLPFAAVLDPRQLQRFKNEALAAAQLDHPHIVDVYGVGCERGVHYYAMRFIEGETLADVIRQLRDRVSAKREPKPLERPDDAAADETPHTAAFLTERSSKTPAYFQSVARLGRNVAEALDHAHQHGIVHRDVKPSNVMLDRDGKAWVTDFGLAHIETGDSLTMTGDVLGTLRYMSPEQALGERRLIDHRTDVYSLGATLYELATLQPLFPDSDRKQLLRRIACEEPPRPSKQNPAIPADLETILLKATAKDPQERYTTAQELADDLGRFLEHKTIRATRATWRQRGTKWLRRHAAMVGTAAIVLMLAVVGLAVATGLIWRAQQDTEDALVAEREAKQQTVAAGGRAESHRQRAEATLEIAGRALNEIYLQVMEQDLQQHTEISDRDQRLLAKVLTFYEELARQDADNPQMKFSRADAYRRVGNICARLRFRRLRQGEAALREAIRLFEQLSRADPANRRFRRYVPLAHYDLGRLLTVAARWDEAKASLQHAIQLYRTIKDPLGEAESQELCRCYLCLGSLLLLGNRKPEARVAYEAGVEVSQDLMHRFGRTPRNRQFYGTALAYLGTIDVQTGHARRGMSRLQSAMTYYPPVARGTLLDAYVRLKQYEKALPLAEQYVKAARSASAYKYRGTILTELKRHNEALPDLAKSLELAPDDFRLAAHVYQMYVAIFAASRRDDRAVDVFRREVKRREENAARFPDEPAHRSALAAARLYLGDYLSRTGKRTEAAAQWRQALAVLPDPYVDFKVRIHTPGRYRLFLRYDGHDEHSESLFARIVELADGPDGDAADWFLFFSRHDADFATDSWQGHGAFEYAGSFGHVEPTEWTIRRPGAYTIRLSMRESGVAVDTLVFQLATLPIPEGNGPPESDRVAGNVFLETAGRVAIEAEHFSSRRSGRGNQGWKTVAARQPETVAYKNFRGSGYLQLLPEGSDQPGIQRAVANWKDQLQHALQRYASHIEREPDNPNWHYLRAAAYRRLRARKKAGADLQRFLQLAERALDERPDDIPLRLRRAAQRQNMRQWDKMADDYSEIIRQFPDTAMAWNRRAIARLYLGRLQAAHQDARRATEINPTNASYWSNRATFAGRLGRWDDAVVSYSVAIRLRPEDAAFLMRRAGAYGKLNRWPEARADLRTAAGMNLSDAHTRNNLAWVLVTGLPPELRLPRRAVALASLATKQQPKNGGFWNTLGVAHYRAGNWAAAIRALQTSNKLLGKSSVAHNGFFLAMAHWQAGRHDEARQWHRKSVAWMQEHRKPDSELQNFRLEAETLLGIPSQPPNAGRGPARERKPVVARKPNQN